MGIKAWGAAFTLSLAFANAGFASPIVLELFTSQGCSSCPPAEVLLKALAKQNPEVVALAYHVDYWDKLGWNDPYATPENTQRQYSYAANGRVFTPELRVGGVHSVVGSNATAVAEAIKNNPPPQPLTLHHSLGKLAVNVPENTWPTGTSLLALHITNGQAIEVRNGENSGRVLDGRFAVTRITPLGVVGQKAKTYEFLLPNLPQHKVVVLAQTNGRGTIWAVGQTQ